MDSTTTDLFEYLNLVQNNQGSPPKPQTVEQFVGLYLFGKYIWPIEAVEIIDVVKAKEAPGFPGIRWEVSPDSYPTALKAAICLVAEDTAFEWLKERSPNHIALTVLRPATREDDDNTAGPSPE